MSSKCPPALRRCANVVRFVRLRFALLLGMVAALDVHPAHAQDEADELTSVVGVRGLDKSDAGKKLEGRDVAAIKRLEAVKINPAELEAFIKEGKLSS
jgi:hypothetical protein